MRISDWSSDVCSSDLGERHHHPAFHYPAGVAGCGRSWRCWPAAGLIHAPALLTARLEWTDVTGDQLIPEWIACVFQCVCVLPVFRAMRVCARAPVFRSEEHTSELQSLIRISYAVFCLKKKKRSHDIQL